MLVTVTVAMTVDIPDGGLTVKCMEEAVARGLSEFRNQAWQGIVTRVEEAAMEQYPAGKMRVKAWEWRTLLTRSGPVAFRRRRFECEAEEKSILLFDVRTGLERYRRTTEAADEALANTSAETTYGRTARFWTSAWESRISTMTAWRSTQRVGGRIREGQAALRHDVFDNGDLPGWERAAPGFVGMEADSTYLSAWRGRGRKCEVYVGMSYTGKVERNGRRRLNDKGVCAGVRGPEEFGRDLFVMAQAKHNVVDVQKGVFISDGAGCLRLIQEDHFPQFTRQLDWAHAKRRIGDVYGRDNGSRAAFLVGLLVLGRLDDACREVRLDVRRKRSRAEALRDLAGYLEANGEDLYGVRRMRSKGVDLPERLDGSGGIERQVGVVVGHRMKRQGMSWTRNGADNLLAVRTALLDRLESSKPRIT
jgi:hypothetical protein